MIFPADKRATIVDTAHSIFEKGTRDTHLKILLIDFELPMGNALQFLNTYIKVDYYRPCIIGIIAPEKSDPKNKKLAAKLGVKLWLQQPYEDKLLAKYILKLAEQDHG